MMFDRNPFYFPMMNQDFFGWFPFFPQVMLGLILIEIVLKGLALYKSARNGQRYWFIAILIINTLGILPLIYLLLNKGGKQVKTPQRPRNLKKK